MNVSELRVGDSQGSQPTSCTNAECGKTLFGQVAFCPYCGTGRASKTERAARVEPASAPVVQPAPSITPRPAPVVQPVRAPTPQPQPASPPPPFERPPQPAALESNRKSATRGHLAL